MKNKNWLIAATILAGLAVAAGAFGAHGLKDLVEPKYIDTFKTGAQYQFYHALAIGFATLTSQFIEYIKIQRVNLFFLLGIILFSGSLYILTLAKAQNTEGLNWIGVLTPVGGLFFLLGWFTFAGIIYRSKI